MYNRLPEDERLVSIDVEDTKKLKIKIIIYKNVRLGWLTLYSYITMRCVKIKIM